MENQVEVEPDLSGSRQLVNHSQEHKGFIMEQFMSLRDFVGESLEKMSDMVKFQESKAEGGKVHKEIDEIRQEVEQNRLDIFQKLSDVSHRIDALNHDMCDLQDSVSEMAKFIGFDLQNKCGMENRNNNCNRMVFEEKEDVNVKVRPFTSKESDWFSYREYFEAISSLAGWSERTKCVRLMGALGSNLMGITSGLGGNFTYQGLLLRLDSIHGLANDRLDAVTKLDSCIKRDEETMAMFGERIRQLVERAHPNFTSEDKEELAVKVLMKGLPTRNDMRLKMKMCMFTSLKEAVIYGSNLELILKEECQTEKTKFTTARGATVVESEKDPIRRLIEDMNKKFSSLQKDIKCFQRSKKESQVQNIEASEESCKSGFNQGHSEDHFNDITRMSPATSPCFICGMIGHWKSDCPHREESYQGQTERYRDPLN